METLGQLPGKNPNALLWNLLWNNGWKCLWRGHPAQLINHLMLHNPLDPKSNLYQSQSQSSNSRPWTGWCTSLKYVLASKNLCTQCDPVHARSHSVIHGIHTGLEQGFFFGVGGSFQKGWLVTR